jgi:hypothetical protein
MAAQLELRLAAEIAGKQAQLKREAKQRRENKLKQSATPTRAGVALVL